MDCLLDSDALDRIGAALRKAYELDSEDEIPSELSQLCAELEQVSAATAKDGRH